MATRTQTRTKRPTTPKSPPKLPPEATTPPAEPVTPVESPVEPVDPPVASVDTPTEPPSNTPPSGFSELGTSLLDKIDQVRASFAQLAPKPSPESTTVVAIDPEVEPSSAMKIADQPSNEEIRRSPVIVQILTTVKQARWE